VLIGGLIAPLLSFATTSILFFDAFKRHKNASFRAGVFVYIFTFSRMFQPYLIGPPSLLPSAF
jgi:hypothetical protein